MIARAHQTFELEQPVELHSSIEIQPCVPTAATEPSWWLVAGVWLGLFLSSLVVLSLTVKRQTRRLNAAAGAPR